MLLSKQALGDVAAILKPDDFYYPKHGAVWQSILDVANAGEPVDPLTVSDALSRAGTLQKIGGAPYLHTLTEVTPSPASAGVYARIVADKAKLRRLGELGQRLQQLAYSPATGTDEVAAVVGQGETFFRELQTGSSSSVTWDALMEQWRADQETPTAPIRTPWAQLNDWLNGGNRKGEMVVVAARPSVGKSNVGLNMVQYAAECGHSTIAFSVEMDRMAIANRMLANGAHVKMKQLIRRELDLETDRKVAEYMATSKAMKFECVDQESINVEQVIGHLRSRPGVDQVFLDYAQLLQPSDRRADRNLQVAHASRSLKIAARELGVSMIVAAQLNRGPVKDGKPRAPTGSDIGESDKLLQDADVVILLDRAEGEQSVIKLIVDKNRNGRRGAMELQFMGAEARVG